jgi:Ca2+-binding RTX toxin-like protein
VSERITRPLALFVVSVLLVALAAGAALAQNEASGVRAANKSDTKHHLPGVCLLGTIFADFIDDAGQNKNCLKGFAGNDILAGFTNDDLIDGGDGDDQLFGESGNESLFATHYIDGWNGNDRINPGSGNDQALGFAGNDRIDGALTATAPNGVSLGNGWQTDDQGNDRLAGESGNDTIVDWVGLDQAFGGTGNDTINVRDGSGGDFVDAGENLFDFDQVFADSGDTVLNAESVVKSAAGAKSAADQERLSPPKVSSAR